MSDAVEAAWETIARASEEAERQAMGENARVHQSLGHDLAAKLTRLSSERQKTALQGGDEPTGGGSTLDEAKRIYELRQHVAQIMGIPDARPPDPILFVLCGLVRVFSKWWE